MDRKQQAKSINKFIGAIANLPPMPIKSLIKSLDRDYRIIKKWANMQNVLHLDFEEIIINPEFIAERISKFIDFPFNLFDRQTASEVIRKRGSDCYPGLLEFEILKKG